MVQILYKKTDSWFQKSHEEFEKLQTSSGKSKKLKFDRLLSPKNIFLQLKHYIWGIYLTLLSTTCLKTHQITYVIFETISHFLRNNSSIFFSSNITYFLQKQPIKFQIFRLFFARVKVHQIPHVIFQTKSQFFFKVWIFFQCYER